MIHAGSECVSFPHGGSPPGLPGEKNDTKDHPGTRSVIGTENGRRSSADPQLGTHYTRGGWRTLLRKCEIGNAAWDLEQT